MRDLTDHLAEAAGHRLHGFAHVADLVVAFDLYVVSQVALGDGFH